MRRFLGPIRQMGYVVPDIEAAMHWSSEEMGIGPFFYNPRVPIEDYQYDGQPHDVKNSVALANAGSIQVELIQTRNDAPSMYRVATGASDPISAPRWKSPIPRRMLARTFLRWPPPWRATFMIWER